MFAHICTAPVLDIGGCTDSVSATPDSVFGTGDSIRELTRLLAN